MIAPAAALELATIVLALSFGSGSVVLALRARTAARSDRDSLRLAPPRAAAPLEAARRLANAARESADAVRSEIVRAAHALAPAIDGVLVYEEEEGALRCV